MEKILRRAQIYIAIPKDAAKDAQDKAKLRIDEISKTAKAGDFSAVAREKSEERETASKGGEVGWLAESQIQPEIRSKVASLPKGAVTDPIRLPDGWYVIKVLDLKEAHTATFDEVRSQLITPEPIARLISPGSNNKIRWLSMSLDSPNFSERKINSSGLRAWKSSSGQDRAGLFR